MTRLFAVSALAAFLVGCSDPALDERIAELEDRVDKLAEGAPAAGPSQEDEAAASKLLTEASQYVDQGEGEKAQANMKELLAKYPTTRAGRAARRMKDEVDVLGKSAVPLKVEKWFQGSEADADGKATLIVFWETWCPHCKREVPKLEDMHEKYGPKGLAVLGLTKQSRDISDEEVESFLTENEVSYPIAREEGNAVSSEYAVSGIPAAVVLKDGKVVWRGHPARIKDAMVDRWLDS